MTFHSWSPVLRNKIRVLWWGEDLPSFLWIYFRWLIYFLFAVFIISKNLFIFNSYWISFQKLFFYCFFLDTIIIFNISRYNSRKRKRCIIARFVATNISLDNHFRSEYLSESAVFVVGAVCSNCDWFRLNSLWITFRSELLWVQKDCTTLISL